MKRTLATLVATGALALPVANAVAAVRSQATTSNTRVVPHKRITTKKFAGVTAQADQWGSVTVTVTRRTTTITTGTTKKVTRRYTDLGGSYTYHTSRSQYIMSQALPILRQEFLQAQSANVQMVSGATYTSEAFAQSLQSAILQAKKS
jgi:uncharacterized protein with FMN-binding domain